MVVVLSPANAYTCVIEGQLQYIVCFTGVGTLAYIALPCFCIYEKVHVFIEFALDKTDRKTCMPKCNFYREQFYVALAQLALMLYRPV